MRFFNETTKTNIGVVSGIAGLLVIFSGIVWYIAHLDGRVNKLEEQVHSLVASSAATASALAEFTRKPAVTFDAIQQKCAELADEVSTGQRKTELGTHYGPEVSKSAQMAMERLGCGLKMH